MYMIYTEANKDAVSLFNHLAVKVGSAFLAF